MKANIFLVVAFISIFFTSCKNEKSVDSEDVVKPEVVDNSFKVTIDVIVKKDDRFQLYYVDDSNPEFNEEKSVWVDVKGSEALQKLRFDLPADFIPTLLRLDFGLNDVQEDIVLQSVELEYYNKKFNMTGLALANYFRPIGETQVDFESGIVKAIVKDGKRVEPVLYPHESVLGPEIIKLVQ